MKRPVTGVRVIRDGNYEEHVLTGNDLNGAATFIMNENYDYENVIQIKLTSPGRKDISLPVRSSDWEKVQDQSEAVVYTCHLRANP